MKLELTKHRGSGQWRKRIAGVDYYFGSFRRVPYKEALQAMRRKALEVAESNGRPVAKPKLRVVELVRQWLDSKAEDVDLGLIAKVTLQKYHHTSILIVETWGERRVDTLVPSDWRDLQLASATRWGYHKQRDLVTVARMIFSWGAEHGVIPAVRIPRSFRKPSRRTDAASEAFSEERWVWTPREFQAAREALRSSRAMFGEAALMLGMNCGLGNKDVSDLRWSHVQKVEGRVVLKKPRSKTGRARMVPLWEDTVEVLEGIRLRQSTGVDPSGPRGEGRVFSTRGGLPLVGDNRRDALAQLFRQKVGKPFYGLRHMFMTIGSQTGDESAVKFMMGHAPKDMADHYLLSPAWSVPRLEKVTEHIEEWTIAGLL